jgi:hypothetical protein
MFIYYYPSNNKPTDQKALLTLIIIHHSDLTEKKRTSSKISICGPCMMNRTEQINRTEHRDNLVILVSFLVQTERWEQKKGNMIRKEN